MAKLISTRSVLFQNRLYNAGEELPFNDTAMVNAWLDAESAVWQDDKPAENLVPKAETTHGDPKPKQASQASKPKAQKKAQKK